MTMYQVTNISYQLLSKPKFCLVEKIKTTGSSYMVAAGLTPGVEGDRQDVRLVTSKGTTGYYIS